MGHRTRFELEQHFMNVIINIVRRACIKPQQYFQAIDGILWESGPVQLYGFARLVLRMDKSLLL
jgi:hypothetical protein